MLRFAHVSLLVLIALIWKVRPTYSAVDICELEGRHYGMYCNCDPFRHNTMGITCFIFKNLTSTDEVWSLFGSQNVVALTLNSGHSAVLSFIPGDALKTLESLETLSIHEGQLGDLKAGAIANLSSLSVLNLERNEITLLDRYSLSNLPKLEKLALNENFLTEILADSFIGLDELKNLYLDRNNISRIENCGFCNLHNLRELDLASNSLTDLTEHEFKGLRYVSRLVLRGNKLQVLNENVFHGMPRLNELSLEENSIRYISPRAFHGLSKLRELRLQYNKLKTLPDHIFLPMSDLLSLDLSHNEIETIQVEVVESLRNVLDKHFVFMFSTNPLKCGCDLAWISRYHKKVKDNHHFEKELRQVQCRSEEELVLASKLALKHCDEAKKKAKPIASDPALSTLGSNFKEATQANPKYQSEYSDSGTSVNRTKQKTEKVSVALDEDNGANMVHTNTMLLISVVVTATFTICNR